MADDFAYSGGTITVCNGTSGTPLTFADMHDADVAGGWGVITEVAENECYTVNCNINFGDGTESTYFRSSSEQIYFTDDKSFTIKNNATLQAGKKQGDWGYSGSAWSVAPAATWLIITSGHTTATFNFYASNLLVRSAITTYISEGTIEILNSIMSYSEAYSSVKRYIFHQNSVSLILKDVFFNNSWGPAFRHTSATCEDVHVHHTTYGLNTASTTPSLTGVRLTEATTALAYVSGSSAGLTFIDPKEHITSIVIDTEEGNYVLERYSCNVHVTDEDGSDISGVTVDCQDEGDNYVWTQGSVTTDGNGDIAEQIITYKRWLGTSETLTTYSPHKFTISAAGYDDFVINNITVDAPVSWHIELQKPRGRSRISGLVGEPITGTFI
jgi:hypothetical protein